MPLKGQVYAFRYLQPSSRYRHLAVCCNIFAMLFCHWIKLVRSSVISKYVCLNLHMWLKWKTRSLRVKYRSVISLTIYPFLFSNIWPNSAPLWYIRLRNVSDLEFDLWRSLKVKCDYVIGLYLYAFLLMFKSNIWPNYAPLQDITLRNVSDLEFDLSRSLKVKCDSVIWLPIYGFLLMFNSNRWPNSAPLQDI